MLLFNGAWQQAHFLNKFVRHLGTKEQQLTSCVQRLISLSRLLVDHGHRWILRMKLGCIWTSRCWKIPGYLCEFNSKTDLLTTNVPVKPNKKRLSFTISTPVLSQAPSHMIARVSFVIWSRDNSNVSGNNDFYCALCTQRKSNVL